MQNEFVRREEAYHLCGALSQRELDPIQLAHNPMSAGWRLTLTASAFNRHASSPGDRAYSYTNSPYPQHQQTIPT